MHTVEKASNDEPGMRHIDSHGARSSDARNRRPDIARVSRVRRYSLPILIFLPDCFFAERGRRFEQLRREWQRAQS